MNVEFLLPCPGLNAAAFLLRFATVPGLTAQSPSSVAPSHVMLGSCNEVTQHRFVASGVAASLQTRLPVC